MIKSALALVAVVVVSSGLFAAEKTANISLSIGGTTNVLTVANHEGWAIKSADEMIATVAWEGAKLVITGVDNGSTTVYAHDADFTTEYVFDVSIATVTIEKTIKQPTDKGDLSNATIRVVTHADCGNLNKAPRILYIGSRCGKHGLTTTVLATAVNAMTEKADVDFYLFDNDGGTYFGSADNTVPVSGYGPKVFKRGGRQPNRLISRP